MKFLEEAERPWGKYQKFYQEDGVWVKRVEVNPKGTFKPAKAQATGLKNGFLWQAKAWPLSIPKKLQSNPAWCLISLWVQLIGLGTQEKTTLSLLRLPVENTWQKTTLSGSRMIMPVRWSTSPLMRNFKLTLEYDGTDFSGWQTQTEGLRTVQHHLEKKLEKIFKKKIHCQASGRTNSGVHAGGQVAHFKVDTSIKHS